MKHSAFLLLAMMVPLASCGGEAESGDQASTQISNITGQSSIIDLSPAELQAAMEAGNIRLIDVRSDDEWAEGFIPGAEHIPTGTFDPATLDLSDGSTIVLYCAVGGRSAKAAEQLADFTGEPAKHLASGIVTWEKANLPISKPQPTKR